MRSDMVAVCELFDFVTKEKRTQREIDDFVNSLAHGKYCLDGWNLGRGRTGKGTQGGHDLRAKYKKFLRRNLKRMLWTYSRMKKTRESNGLP